MTVKFSAFGTGADFDGGAGEYLVGLQSGANVKWTAAQIQQFALTGTPDQVNLIAGAGPIYLESTAAGIGLNTQGGVGFTKDIDIHSGGDAKLIAAANAIVFGNAVAVTANAGDTGGVVSITAGAGTTGDGGNINLTAGDGGNDGGMIVLTAGRGGTDEGGGIELRTGNCTGIAPSGSIDLIAEAAGGISLQAGQAIPAGPIAAGNVQITAGAGLGNDDIGGNVNLTAPYGGSVNITAGQTLGGTLNVGNITLTTETSAGGNAGSINLVAGTGAGHNGGAINISSLGVLGGTDGPITITGLVTVAGAATDFQVTSRRTELLSPVEVAIVTDQCVIRGNSTQIFSQDQTGGAGDIELVAGNALTSGDSGNIALTAGFGSVGAAGGISLLAGGSSVAAGGDVSVAAGDSENAGSKGGDILLVTGVPGAGGVAGKLKINGTNGYSGTVPIAGLTSLTFTNGILTAVT